MFREDNASFGMSAAEEKQKNRDIVRGTALSFVVVSALIRLSPFLLDHLKSH